MHILGIWFPLSVLLAIGWSLFIKGTKQKGDYMHTYEKINWALAIVIFLYFLTRLIVFGISYYRKLPDEDIKPHTDTYHGDES